jgi:hypothetical protein
LSTGHDETAMILRSKVDPEGYYYKGHNLHLQFAPTGLGHLFVFRRNNAIFLVDPTKSTQSLGQNRVREVVTRIHPIGIHSAQILDLKLDQGAGELGGVTKVLRKFIGFELVLSAEDVHQELDDCVHWSEGI